MKSIILIGPYGAGKTTIGRLLADSLGRRGYSLDEYAWTYYREIGLSTETAGNLGDLDSLQWQPYHAHAVKRFLQDHQNEVCIMDLGTGHSLYEDTYFNEMQEVFAPYNVILLMPSPDIDIAIHELNEQNNRHFYKRGQSHTKLNLSFLKHPSSYQLAKYIVYTKDREPIETSKDILALNLE